MARLSPRRRKELDRLVEDTLVDCDNDADAELLSFLYAMENHVGFPFPAVVLGDKVRVLGLDDKSSGGRTGLMARIQKGNRAYVVGLTMLDLPPRVKGRKWIDAYLYWAGKQ